MMDEETHMVTVNHGDAFGHGRDWFTYYCGKCGQQIELTPGPVKCKCGAVVLDRTLGAAQ